MKHLVIGILLAFSITTQAQDNGLVWQTDMLKAVDLSIKEKKPLFLFFTGSDWCGWCRRLQNEVFHKQQFADWAKKNVILVELDFPRFKQQDPQVQQQNMEIAQMFEVRGYPTVWFVTASKSDSQIQFGKIGSTGYIAGGPDIWIGEANRILQSAQ